MAAADATDLSNLTRLQLRSRMMKCVPATIWEGKALKSLDLSYCSQVQTLPEASSDVPLEVLTMNHCRAFAALPSSLHCLRLLKICCLRGTALARLPERVWTAWPKLQELDLSHCTELVTLPAVPCDVPLRVLRLSHCSAFTALPDPRHWPFLQTCSLRGTDIQCLPKNLWTALGRLETLDLYECTDLRALPEVEEGLPKVKEGKGFQSALRALNVGSCWALEMLPATLGCLSRLQELDVTDCWMLKALPESTSMLRDLRYLRVWTLPSQRSLPAAASLKALFRVQVEIFDLRDEATLYYKHLNLRNRIMRQQWSARFSMTAATFRSTVLRATFALKKNTKRLRELSSLPPVSILQRLSSLELERKQCFLQELSAYVGVSTQGAVAEWAKALWEKEF